MIPKIIHYVWLGGGKKPKNIVQCINNWRNIMPDYEIKEWNESNFDCNGIFFTREALQLKKYAFAADYIRLYVLQKEGGFYLDTDVMVYKHFDPLRNNKFVGGTEAFKFKGHTQFRLEAAIIGAEKGHPLINKFLDYYRDRHFITNDGTADEEVIQSILTKIAEEIGYKRINKNQHLENDIQIYSTDTFSNFLCKENINYNTVFAIHQNVGSWIDYSNRGWMFRFCKTHDLMRFYHWIEQIRK